MRKHLFLSLLLAAGMPITAYANPEPQATQQSIGAITGTVVDENGEPVIGASVFEKGNSRNGTATDIDGKFSVKVKPGTMLKVSYIGYRPAEATAANGMIFTLTPSDALLDEVVIVGYGTQKKVNLTGAVSTVDVAKTMEGRPQTDVARALQGAVPGLSITQTSGDLNESAAMRIRGVGTLSNDATSNPLIVVDGIPTEDLSWLNTQDIESISVLKDAASSSIYGSRAAFGVILVQTKGAKERDRVSVNYSNNFAWDKATYLPDYPDVPTQLKAAIQGKARQSDDAVELFGMYFDVMLPYAEAWKEQNNGKSGYRELRPFQSWDDVGDYAIVDGTPLFYADWDIQDIFYNDAAPSQSHNFSVNGTSNTTNYYLSLGYSEKEGQMKANPDEMTKYNVTFDVNTQVTDWLKAGARFNWSRREYTRPYFWLNPYQYLWRWGSFFGPYGTLDGLDFRALSEIKQAGDRTRTSDQTQMTAYLKADIIKGLSVNADFTYQVRNIGEKYADFTVYGYGWGSVNPSYIVGSGSTTAVRTNDKYNTYTVNVYGNYNFSLNNAHNFNVMLGGNAEGISYEGFSGERMQLINQQLPELNLATGSQYASSWAGHSGTAGYFGRINYDYKGIYLLELNGRYDGSSSFPAGDKWAFFPSMSAGYRFSEEAYFTPLKDIVNNGKLRFSFGEIGNDAVGQYMFLSTIEKISDSSVHWLNGSSKVNQFDMPTLVSSSLTWERIRTLNIGIDLGFLNNSLTVGFDWFQRENRDMLAPAKVLPDVVGADAPYENAGTLRTRGWELSLNWNHRFGEVDVYANFNIGDAKTVVTKWDTDAKLLDSYYTGQTYGDIWGFETDRYFTEDDFNGQNADGSWNYKAGIADQTGIQTDNFVYGPGDIKFKDLNGDGKIDGGKGTADDHGDLKVIGNTLPRYEYSFHLGGAWKGFDIDLYFQGVGKRSVWTQSAFAFPLMRSADLTLYANQTEYCQYEPAQGIVDIDQSYDFPRLYPGNEGYGSVPGIGPGEHNYYPQSRYLVDMSYLRLKNVTFGYTLPQVLTRKAYIEKARVYFSADNLALLHKGHDLPVDPEINAGQGGLGNGTWGRIAPITRTLSVGLQVTF